MDKTPKSQIKFPAKFCPYSNNTFNVSSVDCSSTGTVSWLQEMIITAITILSSMRYQANGYIIYDEVKLCQIHTQTIYGNTQLTLLSTRWFGDNNNPLGLMLSHWLLQRSPVTIAMKRSPDAAQQHDTHLIKQHSLQQVDNSCFMIELSEEEYQELINMNDTDIIILSNIAVTKCHWCCTSQINVID